MHTKNCIRIIERKNNDEALKYMLKKFEFIIKDPQEAGTHNQTTFYFGQLAVESMVYCYGKNFNQLKQNELCTLKNTQNTQLVNMGILSSDTNFNSTRSK